MGVLQSVRMWRAHLFILLLQYVIFLEQGSAQQKKTRQPGSNCRTLLDDNGAEAEQAFLSWRFGG